ncbi:MAG: zf-HC2 domain-containing protein [Pyrinomonadaceae bacterium]|nr:zf-HC2 domain-containing protein [Pyrinomonadaceae bacterium]
MKCEDCQKVIEEYFDGELDEQASIEVRAHLMNCEECARQLEALGDEQNVYALYVRNVDVSPALWTGVVQRIHEDGSGPKSSLMMRWRRQLVALFGTPRLSPALTFALLILSVGATAGLMKYINSRQAQTQTTAQKQPESPAPVAPSKVNDQPVENTGEKEREAVENGDEQLAMLDDKSEERLPPVLKTADRFESRRALESTTRYPYEQTPEQLVREAEQKYRAAITMLARDAKRRRTLLEPDVRERFEQTLAAVDRTISETRRAARQQPDDPVAVQYMLAAYAKKVEVLREMATYRAEDRDIQ